MAKYALDPQKLAAMRQKRGYTRDALAEKAYCKTEAYIRWESGIDTMSPLWLKQIAQALDCRPSELCSPCAE